jgi:hypothetical protein
MPLIAYVPKDKATYNGDILYSGRLLGVVPGGNVKHWMETFNFLKSFENATFIPKHGKPGALAEFQKSNF